MKKNNLSNLKVVILGHGVGVKFCIEALAEVGIATIAIITHPKEEHEADQNISSARKKSFNQYHYNVFNAETDFNIRVIQAKDVNLEDSVLQIKSFDPDYIISIGCRNIIKKEFLDSFPNKVLNIHTAPLPEYRGAAGDTWMILNNDTGKKHFGVVHFVDTGVDSGDIIVKKDFYIEEKAFPIDIFKSRMDIIGTLAVSAITNLQNPEFVPEKQVIDDATVFPRLNTLRDGKIDFTHLKGEEIIRFIFAFSYPYSGAYTFLAEHKISILDAEFHTDKQFHPFANGLIIGRTKDWEYKVIVNKGYIIIKEIEVDGFPVKQSKYFKLGKKLKS